MELLSYQRYEMIIIIFLILRQIESIEEVDHMKEISRIKINSPGLRCPLWWCRHKGYHDARLGAKNGDIKERVYEFADGRIYSLKTYRNRSQITLNRYSEENDFVAETTSLVLALESIDNRYKLNGTEREVDKIYKEHRRHILEESLMRISGKANEAQNVVNDSVSKFSERLSMEIRSYYYGLAKYMRKKLGKKNIDATKATLNMFMNDEKDELTNKLILNIPELNEAIAKFKTK